MKKLTIGLTVLVTMIIITNAQWEQTNFPYSGTVSSFAVSGTDLFVGTDGGGIWKRPLSGIEGIDSASATPHKINIYPNPSSDIIALNIDQNNLTDLTLNIYNVTGSLVKTILLKQNQQQINVNDLSSGIYLVEIKSKEWTEKQKLIIQR